MARGTVDVAVLAPINTARWTPETVDRHVESVRKKFLATLAHWPDQA
jgi:putative phosphoserine phosphatase/1-acylglycerol-3-phosphate O-acyltransferase